MTVTKNSIRRLTAFTLIDKILSGSPDLQSFIDCVHWFISFQGNSKKLLHYTEGIKGCGIMLEEKLRGVFFDILSKFGKKLSILTIDNKTEDQETKSESYILLLQAFECKFLARDFDLLLNKIGIFNLLFRGGELILECHSLNRSNKGLSQALIKQLSNTI